MIALLTFLELALSAHCRTWRETPNGWRCVVVEHRVELIDGWHAIGYGHPVCTRKCGADWMPGEKVAGR